MIMLKCILFAFPFHAAAPAYPPVTAAGEPCAVLAQAERPGANATSLIYTFRCPGASATATTLTYSPATPPAKDPRADRRASEVSQRTIR